jgi:uncharacterized protein YqgV (UPF0045/DUF77 family)
VTVGQVRLEFTVEPFVPGHPGPHVGAAIDAVQARGLAVEIGPFSSVAGGETDAIAAATRDLVAAAIGAGASRLAVQIEPADRAVTAPPDDVAVAAGEGGSVDRAAPPALLTLHGALDRLIEQVEHELGGKLPELSREDKQQAVRLLDDRGAFLLRRSVEFVADALGVSRITVYNYLNAIR